MSDGSQLAKNKPDTVIDVGIARVLFAQFDQVQRQRLYDEIADALQGVPEPLIERQVAEFAKVDPAYAAGVLAAVMRARRPANCNDMRPLAQVAG